MIIISRQREKCDRLPYTARLESGDCATCSARAARAGVCNGNVMLPFLWRGPRRALSLVVTAAPGYDGRHAGPGTRPGRQRSRGGMAARPSGVALDRPEVSGVVKVAGPRSRAPAALSGRFVAGTTEILAARSICVA